MTVLAGCSSSSGPTAAPSSSASPIATSAPTVDPAARRALDRATTTMGQIRAYEFVADTTLQASKSVRSRVTGRVVRGRGVAYRLNVQHRTTQVVRARQ